jgi:hypothetical protein
MIIGPAIGGINPERIKLWAKAGRLQIKYLFRKTAD